MKKLLRLMVKERSGDEFPKSHFLSQNETYAEYEVGEWSYGHPKVLSYDNSTKLIIGNFCSIADNVTILLGGEHCVDWVTTYPFPALFSNASHFSGHPKSRGNVVIGHDVWIGYGATILSGVKIGNGSVIGAGAVVTKDVAPYAIVAGNPARFIRFRFTQEQKDALEQMAWWDWPLDEIEKAWPLLLSQDVEKLITMYKFKFTIKTYK